MFKYVNTGVHICLWLHEDECKCMFAFECLKVNMCMSIKACLIASTQYICLWLHGDESKCMFAFECLKVITCMDVKHV